MAARVIRKTRTGGLLVLRIIVILILIAGVYTFSQRPELYAGIKDGLSALKNSPEIGETLLSISLPSATEARDNFLLSALNEIFPAPPAQSPSEVKPQLPLSSIMRPGRAVEPVMAQSQTQAAPSAEDSAEDDVPVPVPAVTPGAAEGTALPADSNELMAVTFSPSSSEGYNEANGVFINNQTSYDVDVEALLNRDLRLSLSSDGPQILIIHTHGSESYFPDERDYYVPTDIERTEDTRFNVVRIGDELTGILEQKGLSVIHDRNIYDYPTYNGAYTRTLESITTIVQDNPTIKIVIDIHRDSIITAAGTMYKAISEVQDENTSQMMFVIGTDDTGLTHPDWLENLAMSVQLQQQLNNNYQSLMRPINLRRERFNQHATVGSFILEVGTSGNTLTEATAAIQRFGEVAGNFWVEFLNKP